MKIFALQLTAIGLYVILINLFNIQPTMASGIASLAIGLIVYAFVWNNK